MFLLFEVRHKHKKNLPAALNPIKKQAPGGAL